MSNYDVLILGSGPGGYVTAIRASQLGFKTAVVEREHLGGICLNWGCIPTKALLRSSELFHTLSHAESYGLTATGIGFELDKIVKRSRGVAKQLSDGVKFLMKKNKIDVLDGNGVLTGVGKVSVTSADNKVTQVTAKHIILATGARARELPDLKADGKLVWTYKHAMVPAEMPKSLLVIGSGAIGIEFASFYRNLGAEVTVVEVLDRILPVEDAEISAMAAKSFTSQGMKLLTKTSVKALDRKTNSVVVTLSAEGQADAKVEVDRVILAIGITGNVENIGLETVGVKVERGHVVIDPYGRTNVPGIYAIGDLAGPPWLAHKASHEGVVCIEKIANVDGVHAMDVTNIPGCTYSMPQIASVGWTEAKAIEAGYTVKVGRFPYIGNGKAIALGETFGIIKTVFDAKTGALLGAHMIGAEVTELIQGFAVARTLETTEAELMATVFPHPTLSEMMHESVLSAYGRALHI
jgi:dihydrolipoamide dehydrogenase